MIIILTIEEVKTLREQVRQHIDPDTPENTEFSKVINKISSELLNFFTRMDDLSECSADLSNQPEIVETFLKMRDTMNSININTAAIKDLKVLGQQGLVLISI